MRFANQPAATAVMSLRFHHAGERFISILICVSALGAVSGMIFTGSRIFYAVGKDYRPLSFLGHWGRSIEAPIPSLMLQALVTLALLLCFGLYANGFERLVIFTGPAFYLFFFLTGIALIVLRFREPTMPRPFRVPLYPITPILFIAFTLFMFHASTTYAIRNRTWEGLWTIVVSAIGVGLCVLARRDASF
jgi:amino acid transporter